MLHGHVEIPNLSRVNAAKEWNIIQYEESGHVILFLLPVHKIFTTHDFPKILTTFWKFSKLCLTAKQTFLSFFLKNAKDVQQRSEDVSIKHQQIFVAQIKLM